MICLYGRVVGGNDSWARVTAGLRRALDELGLLSGFCAVSEAVSDLDADGMTPGAAAPVGVFIGPPANCSVMMGRGLHQHRLAIIAANSSWLPSGPMRSIDRFVTGLIGPSVWSCEVIQSHTSLPTYLWEHGVSATFRPLPDVQPPRAPFSALHFASSHKQRKGTYELIEAWARARRSGGLPPDCLLRLVMDGPRGYFRAAIDDACRSCDVPDGIFELRERMNLSEHETSRLYQQHHLVVQPSRAEGFGMCVLEARASGVPVVATLGHGHDQHFSPAVYGAVAVATGSPGPIDDGPGALAPTLSPVVLERSLSEAYERYGSLARQALDAADEVHRSWSWTAATRRFVGRYGAALGLS